MEVYTDLEQEALSLREIRIVYNLLSKVRALEENQSRLLGWIKELSDRADSVAQGHTGLYLRMLKIEDGIRTTDKQDRRSEGVY